MKHPGNWEPTVYASHDPVDFVDPSGLFGFTVTFGGAFRFGTIGAEVSPIGFAITVSEENGIQLAGFNSIVTRFGPGVAIGAGISVGFSPDAQKISDFEGVFIGASADIGIGGIFGSKSLANDDKLIRTIGVTAGKGVGFGTSLDLGYQNVFEGSWEK